MVKKGPTILEFDTEAEKQAFLNWATGPSEPSEELDYVKNLMRQVQKIDESMNPIKQVANSLKRVHKGVNWGVNRVAATANQISQMSVAEVVIKRSATGETFAQIKPSDTRKALAQTNSFRCKNGRKPVFRKRNKGMGTNATYHVNSGHGCRSDDY